MKLLTLFFILTLSFNCAALNWVQLLLAALVYGEYSETPENSKNQSATSSKSAEKESLSPNGRKMLSFNLGVNWIEVAKSLGLSSEDIDYIKAMYTDVSEWETHINSYNKTDFHDRIVQRALSTEHTGHLTLMRLNDAGSANANNKLIPLPNKDLHVSFHDPVSANANNKLIPLPNKDLHVSFHDPEITEAISYFLSKALETVSTDDLFTAVEKIDFYLATCARSAQSTYNNPEKTTIKATSTTGEPFDSYIFLIWVKHPERRHEWGHVIPNTKILPHQQTVYDWATKNPDKLTVLWFDSENLTNQEINQYYDFEKAIKDKTSNIAVLDIRDVAWCSTTLKYYKNKLPVETLSPSVALNRSDFSSLGDKVDFIRERLLYEGGHAIETALKNTEKRPDLYNLLPHKGIYFDLDYLPRKYDSSEITFKEIYLDDTQRALSGYSVDSAGIVLFGGRFFNSLLAVNQDHLDLLGEAMCLDIDSDYSRLTYYKGLLTTLTVNRERVGSTTDFRMRGRINAYEGDYLRDEGMDEYPHTWSTLDKQCHINKQKNMPICFSGSDTSVH